MAIIQYSSISELMDLFIEKNLKDTTQNINFQSNKKINQIIDFMLKNKTNNNYDNDMPVNEYWYQSNSIEIYCNNILNNINKNINKIGYIDENFKNTSCIETLNCNFS